MLPENAIRTSRGVQSSFKTESIGCWDVAAFSRKHRLANGWIETWKRRCGGGIDARGFIFAAAAAVKT